VSGPGEIRRLSFYILYLHPRMAAPTLIEGQFANPETRENILTLRSRLTTCPENPGF
jgi:hypothetical protein